jgi:hypothetical protein
VTNEAANAALVWLLAFAWLANIVQQILNSTCVTRSNFFQLVLALLFLVWHSAHVPLQHFGLRSRLFVTLRLPPCLVFASGVLSSFHTVHQLSLGFFQTKGVQKLAGTIGWIAVCPCRDTNRNLPLFPAILIQSLATRPFYHSALETLHFVCSDFSCQIWNAFLVALTNHLPLGS